MKNIFSKLKNEKGQSAVEFSLVAILLLLVVFGITEFGRAWYRADLLKGAANIAARTYAVTQDSVKATSAAKTVIQNWDNTINSISISSTVSQVTVTVSEMFQTVVPHVLPMLKPNNQLLTITRSATYRVE